METEGAKTNETGMEQQSAIQAPKQKRPLTEKQRANLEKGWEARRKLSAKVQEEKKLVKQELEKLEMTKQNVKDKSAIKKANKIITETVKMKKAFELPDNDDSEDEEIIIPIQPKKPKKKKVVYLPPESESEEEVIYKRQPKPSSKPKPVENIQEPTSRLVFF
jgi:hypothetical protein